MGRPTKSVHEKRIETLALRLTTAEKSHIEQQAAVSGLSLAKYCRKLILKSRFNGVAEGSNTQLLYELNKLGLELADLKRASVQGCDPSRVETLLDKLETTLDEVAINGA